MALLTAASSISSMSLVRASHLTTSAPLGSRTASRCAISPSPHLLSTDLTTSREDAAGTVMAGAIFAAMANASSASATQEMLNMAAAGDDNRGLALLLPLVPAIGWVLFNILKPGLNQLERMKSTKGGVVVGAAGMGAMMMMAMAPEADAAEAISGDSRGLLLLFVLLPAVAWVVFNILRPALNQLEKMRVTKGIVVGAAGMGAAMELLIKERSAMAEASEIAEIAVSGNSDSRATLLVTVLIPAIAWVLFNILRPALNQFDKMRAQK